MKFGLKAEEVLEVLEDIYRVLSVRAPGLPRAKKFYRLTKIYPGVEPGYRK